MANETVNILSLTETISSKLSLVEMKKGRIIICNDTGDIYFDSAAINKRVQLTDIIKLNTEDDRDAILAPLTDKLYLVKENNLIYRYDGAEWNKIADPVTVIDDTIVSDIKTWSSQKISNFIDTKLQDYAKKENPTFTGGVTITGGTISIV